MVIVVLHVGYTNVCREKLQNIKIRQYSQNLVMHSFEKFDQATKLAPYSASITSFHKFIIESDSNKTQLFQLIQSCKVDEIKCRFNVWRLVLGIIDIDADIGTKKKQIDQHRQSFAIKKSESLDKQVPGKSSANISRNPLMKAMMKTPKVQENSDQFLKDEIRKDVQRTYQQMPFFQNETLIKLFSSVLFVWCKKNPEVSYKQGMNEILASIVYVYFQETYSTGRLPQGMQTCEEESIKETYIHFNSVEYAQADIYGIFEKVMNIQHQMYRTQADSSLKGAINPNSKNNTPILQRIITITDHKLKTLDLELFRAIKLQDVQTKTFLLRWIRCMHTREFSLENSFLIWDSIFLEYYLCPVSKEKSQFDFIDTMCLAMFIYMRTMALSRQTAYEIQQIYQKYPQLKKGGYLEELISLAWSLSDALRQSASNSGDWFGQESGKVNSKLQFLGNKESPAGRAFQKQQELKLENQKQAMKKAAEEAKQFQKKQIQVSLTKANPSEEEQISQHVSNQQNIPKNQIQDDRNHPIVLQPQEWKKLSKQLKICLSLTKDSESRSQLSSTLEFLEQKIAETQAKMQQVI